MNSTTDSIASHRKRAAELSGGTSGNAIYDAIVKLMIQHGFRGAALDYGAGLAGLTRRLLDLHLFDSLSAGDLMSCPRDLQGKVQWIEQDLNCLHSQP
jgi:hypothetical protein